MDEETTRHLEDTLKTLDIEAEGTDFLSAHPTAGYDSFHAFVNAYIAEKDLVVRDVINDSGISDDYAYALLNGRKNKPGRDYVISICIACGMSYSETNRALKIAGLSSLYPKNERDVRIAICINSGMRNVTEVDLMLDKYGLEPLAKTK